MKLEEDYQSLTENLGRQNLRLPHFKAKFPKVHIDNLFWSILNFQVKTSILYIILTSLSPYNYAHYSTS